MSPRIRKIEASDFPTLLELFEEFAHFEKTPEKMTNSLDKIKAQQEFLKGFIAEDNGTIVGYCTYFFTYHTWTGKCIYLDDLYVKPGSRGMGFGAELMQNVIKVGKKEDCAQLRWQVSRWNAPAIDFYDQLGAEIDDVEMNCTLSLI